MNRWLLYLIGSLFLCLVNLSHAQLRQIPADAQRGWLRHIQGFVLSIDEKQVHLAPGGTIRNQLNLIVVPAALPNDGALAEFLLDRNGQIARAWLLTAQEAARERPQRP